MEKEHEPRFKVGDKVICINSEGRKSLTYLKKYTVERVVDGKFIGLSEVCPDKGNLYGLSRFIPSLSIFEILFL